MASKTGIASLGPFALRDQAGLLVQPDEIAHKIENMVPTEEGSLRSVPGPAALVDTFDAPQPIPGEEPEISHLRPTSSSTDFTPGSYVSNICYGDRLYGIYHCLLSDNERDVLLLHTEDEIWEFTGWSRGWRRIVSDDLANTDYGYNVQVEIIDQPQFPTQFACTGTGVVIVPQNSRPLFYDGHKVGPLGFEAQPAPPQGLGPANSATYITSRGVGVNDRAYCHDGTPYDSDATNYRAGSTEGFGSCRVGTVTGINYDAAAFTSTATGDANSPLTTAGWLLPGEWRCMVQFVDHFGNLSAPSAPSDTLPISYQPSVIPDPDSADATGGASKTVALELLKKQVAWANIPKGPDGTIGRILYRTKDIVNSGDGKFYYLPQDASGVHGSYATMPDNVTTFYPDNISDSTLTIPVDNISPAPRFKVCTLAYGRLWVGNTHHEPNLVQASMPGRWGTFSADTRLYPDPVSEVTGIHNCNQGLLAFTMRGVHLINPSGTDQFSSVPLSSEIGCVAPSSIQSIPGGRVIWLGDDGFYTYDGASVTYASAALRRDFRKVTKTRMKQACSVYDPRTREYRCWVSVNGSERNNMCFIYDGAGWRTRTDVKASAACVTKDHRNLVLAAGEVHADSGHAGVYVVDHAHNRQDTELTEIIDSRTAVIETGWMSSQASLSRKTTRVLYLWLRESEDADVTIEVFRDWRNDVIETVTTKRYSSEDVPAFWGSTKFGDTGAKFVTLRPYWTRAQIYLPSNEVFKFKIKGSGLWEFIGLQVDVAPKAYGGAQTPP